jgi:hypothetical protein
MVTLYVFVCYALIFIYLKIFSDFLMIFLFVSLVI